MEADRSQIRGSCRQNVSGQSFKSHTVFNILKAIITITLIILCERQLPGDGSHTIMCQYLYNFYFILFFSHANIIRPVLSQGFLDPGFSEGGVKTVRKGSTHRCALQRMLCICALLTSTKGSQIQAVYYNTSDLPLDCTLCLNQDVFQQNSN